MFHVVLYEPEIPPNTGNIIRLCANSGCRLHLIEPVGFHLDNKNMRRAGLDYRERADIRVHSSLDQFRQEFPSDKIYAVSTRGGQVYTDITYRPDDVFLFGPETRGLPMTLLETMPPDHVIKIPMKSGNRSLNLANSVAVIVYEAWRQNDFQ